MENKIRDLKLDMTNTNFEGLKIRVRITYSRVLKMMIKYLILKF